MKSKVVFVLIIVLYIPFIIWSQYALQSNLSNNVGIFRTITSYFNLIIDGVILVWLGTNKSRVKNTSRLMSLIVLWTVLIVIQCFFTATSIERLSKNLVYVTFWSLNALFVYRIVKDRYIERDIVVKRYIFLYFVSLACFIFMYYMKLSVYGGLSTTSMNHSYFLLCQMPWLFLIKKKKLRLILIVSCLVAIIFSLKRTSLICVALVGLLYIHSMVSKYSVFFRIVLFAMLALFAFYGTMFIDKHYLGGGMVTRIEQSEEDDMGSRPVIWAAVYKKYSESSLTQMLFGHGHDTVYYDCGIGVSAHSEYFETLYDYGIIMLCLLFVIVFVLIRNTLWLYKRKSRLALPFASSVIIYLVLSISSHLLLYPQYFAFLAAFWGYIESVKYKSFHTIEDDNVSNKVKSFEVCCK